MFFCCCRRSFLTTAVLHVILQTPKNVFVTTNFTVYVCMHTRSDFSLIGLTLITESRLGRCRQCIYIHTNTQRSITSHSTENIRYVDRYGFEMIPKSVIIRNSTRAKNDQWSRRVCDTSDSSRALLLCASLLCAFGIYSANGMCVYESDIHVEMGMRAQSTTAKPNVIWYCVGSLQTENEWSRVVVIWKEDQHSSQMCKNEIMLIKLIYMSMYLHMCVVLVWPTIDSFACSLQRRSSAQHSISLSVVCSLAKEKSTFIQHIQMT